jgi:hypothetical protein
VLAVLVAGTTVLVSWLPGYATERVRATLAEKLGTRLDAQVEVGEVELSWGHVVVSAVTVQRDGVQLVTLDRIDVDVDRDALWNGYAIVTDAQVRGGTVKGTRPQLTALLRQAIRRREDTPPSAGRIRAIPPQIGVDNLAVDVTDGDRRVAGVVDVTVHPRQKRFELALRDAVVGLDAEHEIVAQRLATNFTLGAGNSVPIPLQVELAGFGTRLTPRISVAGVHGTVTVHDPALQEISVDLQGGFADRADGDASDLWSVVGRIHRDLTRGQLTLQMKSFELGRVPSVLRHLPLVDSESATVGGRVALELGAGVVRVDGKVAIDGLNVRHPTLARTTVRDVGFELRLTAEIEPEARRVRIPTAWIERDGVRVEWTAALDHPADRMGRHYRVDMRMPSRPCQSVLDALPPDLVPALQGFELEGDFDMWARVDADFADLPNLVFEGDVAAWNCKVTVPPPDANAARLSGGFTHKVTMRDGRVRSVHLFSGSRTFTPLDEISPYMIGAVLTTEDGGFFRHKGFLPSQFRTALERNLAAGRVRLGASTISMQMVKNVWLSHERTLSRKAQEMFLTWYVETALSKNRILELYLNIVELGPGIYGVTRASEHYFGKSASDLTPPEAAYLALMLPSPVRRHVHYCRGMVSESFKVKIKRILGIMAGRGRIDALDYEVYKEGEIEFDLRERGDSGACLAEIDHLMASNEGQRALSGLLLPPSDLELIVEEEPEPPVFVPDDPEPPADDPASTDAPGRPAMDDEPFDEPSDEPSVEPIEGAEDEDDAVRRLPPPPGGADGAAP